MRQGQLWTVGVEIGFYILVPMLFGLSRKRLAFIFAASLSLSIAQIWLQSSWVSTTIPAYLWIFLLGAFARLTWDRVGWSFKGTFPIWLAAHLLLWVVPDYQAPSFSVIASMLTLTGCTLSFAHTLPKISSILRKQDFSYGIYLYHVPVILTLLWIGRTGGDWVWVEVFAATFLLAVSSWFLVERPALKLKSNNSASQLKLSSGSIRA